MLFVTLFLVTPVRPSLEDGLMRRVWIGILALLLLLFAYRLYNVSHKEEIKSFDPLAASPGTPRASYQELGDLMAAYERADVRTAQAIQAAKTDAERLEGLRVRQHLPETFAGRFVELARRYPGDETAFDAALWVIVHCPLAPEAATALQIATRDHLQSERIMSAGDELADSPSQPAETLLREVIAHSRNSALVVKARFSLGQMLKAQAADKTQYADAGARAREAEALFEQVIADDGGIIDGPQGQSLGKLATAELFELRDLAIGKPVPEIDGMNVEGNRMTLSSFRGKVVVIEFWGSWCSVCKEIFPLYQELAKKFADKPFILLGVNTDVNPLATTDYIHDLGMTWPSWRDGGDARGGPICRRWNVKALPTTYVVDAKGIIRYRFGSRADSHDASRFILDPAGAVRHKWDQRFVEITQAVDTLLKEQSPVVATGPAQ
jgi:thiol-disulfide isomerase/thioredoxin